MFVFERCNHRMIDAAIWLLLSNMASGDYRYRLSSHFLYFTFELHVLQWLAGGHGPLY